MLPSPTSAATVELWKVIEAGKNPQSTHPPIDSPARSSIGYICSAKSVSHSVSEPV